jgi:hypothetical protein
VSAPAAPLGVQRKPRRPSEAGYFELVPIECDHPHHRGIGALRAAIQRVLDDSGFRRGARDVAVDMAALPDVAGVVGALLGFAAR